MIINKLSLLCTIITIYNHIIFAEMGPKKESKPRKPRNYVLGGSGVMRFGQARMRTKRGVFKLKTKGGKKAAADKKPARMVKKEIGGEKNGGTRTVRINRMVSGFI